ncbi:MAG: hypothetical protein FWH01_08850 [Oscillospiraceae bacterium]|nr:hypothetical protein [Oscillospiraceae bacterium]
MKSQTKNLIKASAAIAIALVFILTVAANAFAAEWSSATVSNIQIKGDNIFISQLYGDTFITQDFKALTTAEAFGEPLFGMIAMGDTLFFNDGRYCTKDGITFIKTVIDGKEDHNGLYDLNYWKGTCFGVQWNNETNNMHLCASQDGINWTSRLSSSADNSWWFSFYALRDTLFVYVGGYDMELDHYRSCLYMTKDLLDFTDLGDRYGEPIATYDGTFLISEVHEDDKESDKSYTYYVCNDGADWRIMEMDGAKQINTSFFRFNQFIMNINETLDNVLPGQKPFDLSDYDEGKHTALYDGTAHPAEVSVDGLYARVGVEKYDFASIIYSGTMFLSNDGEKFNWYMGDAMMQKTAANGKGQFLVSGEHGLFLICSLTDIGGTYNLNVEPHSFDPDGSGIKMLKYIEDRYIACTFSGALYSSWDGRNWFGLAALPTNMNDIAYSSGAKMYYAACDDGIYASKSMYKWDQVYASDEILWSICAGRDRLVASGARTLIYSYFYLDAGIWMKADAPDLNNETLYGVAYGDGVYIAAGGTGWGGYGIVLRSTDGFKWETVHDGEEGYEENTNGDNCYANCANTVIYDDGRFILTGLNRASDGFDMTSIDGLKWNKRYTYRWGLDIAAVEPGVYVRVKEYKIELFDGAFLDIPANVDTSYDDWSAIAPNRVLETQFEGAARINASSRV